MANPYAQYATPTSPSEGNPYAQFAPQAGGGVQDWEPQGYSGTQMAARKVGLAAQGVNDGFLPTVIGGPVDAAAWALRQIGIGQPAPTLSGLITGETPKPLEPFGGSKSIKRGIDYLATAPGRVYDAVAQGSTTPLTDDRTSRIEPVTQGERTAYGAGEGTGNVLAMLAPAAAVSRLAAPGSVTSGVANALSTQPVIQAVAGAAGGAVTGATDNPWLGLAAGVGVPLGVAGVQKGAKIASSLVQPFTSGGRDAIVGRTLNSLADDPARAAENMLRYRAPVDGFRLSAAKASGDDSLMATENALTRAGTGFGERANANNAALTTALNNLDAGGDPRAFVAALGRLDAGAAQRAQAALDALPPNVDPTTAGQAIQNALRGRFDSLVTSRSNAASPLYDAARASTQPVPALPLASYVDDLVRANKGEPQAAMERVRGLLFNQDGQLDRTANGMMASREAIGDMLDSQSIGKHTRDLLLGVRRRLDDALAVIPEEQAARGVFRDMSVPLRPFDAEQGSKTVAGAIGRDRFNNTFLQTPELVTGNFLRPGAAGTATVRELRATGTGDAPLNALEGVVASRVRDGASINNIRPAVNALSPRLAGQVDDVQATGTLAQGFRSSPAGRFLTGDLDAAVKSTLGAPDSANRMRSLVVSVGDDPQAVAGMRSAIIDDFRRAARSSVAEDATGNPRLVAAGSARWLDSNREALTGILSDAQIAGLDAISRALRDQSRTAVKVAGSDTGRNLATQNIVESLLWKGAGESAIMSPLRKALGLVYGGANTQTADRLAEVMLDPAVAAALMQRPSLQSVARATTALDRLGLATAVGANVETRPTNPLRAQ
tara:strand:- start:6207 stop:8711 length:2505 start_codon:yes stop_codon:yes gene_type:complete